MISTVAKPKRKKTGGRVKGTPNKIGQELQAMLKASLSRVGGIEYLVKQAEENPNAYMTMLNKQLPNYVEAVIEHGGEVDLSIKVEFIASPDS